MGQLISILLAVGSLALGDLGLSGGLRLPLAVPFLLLFPYALAAAQHRQGLRGRFRSAATLGRLCILSPVLSQYAAVGLLGWQESVEGWLGADVSVLEWPGLGALLALAPFVLFSVAAIDAEARVSSRISQVRGHIRSFQLRMLGSGLAPIVIYLLVAALLGRSESLRIHVEEVALANAAFTGVMLVSFLFLLPFLLEHAWDTEPLAAGPQRELLEHVAARAEFRCKELVVWRTGGLVANAAIVGVTPGSRRVFFSDALLARLGPRELAAVFAHEMGHARRHHVPLFVAWALAFFAGLDLLVQELDPEAGALGLGLFVGGLGLWLVAFGWLSRRVELEADLFALELLQDGEGLVLALDSVAPGRPAKSGWRHFSSAQRIGFLRSAGAAPRLGRRLRRRLCAARWLGALVLALVLSFQGSRFLGSLDADQARASLRLGRYATAAAQLAEVEAAPEDLVALVALSSSEYPRDFPSRAEAAQACRDRALALAPDADSTQGWWLLAALAGDREAEGRLD